MMLPRNLAAGLAVVALAACGESATQPHQVPEPDRVLLKAASSSEITTLCVGNIFLESQVDIDAFNCTHVTGNVSFWTSIDIVTNLDGLSELQSVGGSLTIAYNANLLNVDGLSSLTSVGGSFYLTGPSLLTNLDGLSALRSVGGNLDLFANHALLNVDGLSGLTSVGKLIIMLNNALENLDGLSALTSVGSLLIIDNPVLSKCACGLYRVVPGVGGGVRIEDNAPGCNSEADITEEACAECGGELELLFGIIATAQNEGSLKANHSRALSNTLRSAEKKAGKAKFDKAAIDMDAFIVQVRELEATKQINSDTAATLIKGATAIRDIWRATSSKTQGQAR